MTKNVTRKGGAHHPGIVVSGMHVPRPFRLAGRHAQHTNPNNTFRFTQPNVAAVGPARTPFGFGMGAMAAAVPGPAVPGPVAARSRSRSRGTKRGKSRSRSGSQTGKKGKKSRSPSAEL